ncbi:MAG: hypothetical protein ABJD07_15845 [Gemmatimonadaceae bacterium]
MRGTLIAMLACIVGAAPAPAQAPSAAELADITRRGRDLAAYDVAISGAQDALNRRGVAVDAAMRYVVRREPRGFVVRFGHWGATRDTFFVSHEATQRNGPEDFGADAFVPEQIASDAERADVKAVELTGRELGRRSRPYRNIVVPAAGGTRWVYWLPAQTRLGVWTLGDDVRYLVSADGGRIVDRRVLHRALTETVLPLGAEYGSHTSSTGVPEDSDVMQVLLRRPAVPEIISGGGRIYYLTVDGTIVVGTQ